MHGDLPKIMSTGFDAMKLQVTTTSFGPDGKGPGPDGVVHSMYVELSVVAEVHASPPTVTELQLLISVPSMVIVSPPKLSTPELGVMEEINGDAAY